MHIRDTSPLYRYSTIFINITPKTGSEIFHGCLVTTILFAMSWLVIFPAVHMASWGIMVANGVNYPHFTDIPYSETLPYQAGIIVVCCTTMGFLKFVFGRFYNFLQKVEVTAGNQPNA